MTTQDRMPPIAAESMTGNQKKAAEEFAAGRGYGVRGPFAVMLRSPEVMLRAKAMGDYLRFRNVLPKSTIEAIAEARRPQAMQEDEAAAYDFSIELHRRRSVSDATYARALKLFGEQGIVDLVGISGYYTFNAMMMNVARSQVDIDNVPPLQHFPD